MKKYLKVLLAVSVLAIGGVAVAHDSSLPDFVYNSTVLRTDQVQLSTMLQQLRGAILAGDYHGRITLSAIPTAPTISGQTFFFNLTGVGPAMEDTSGNVFTVPLGALVTTYPDAGYVSSSAQSFIQAGSQALTAGVAQATFATAYTSAPTCTCTDKTDANGVRCVAGYTDGGATTTKLSIVAAAYPDAGTSTDTIAYICTGQK